MEFTLETSHSETRAEPPVSLAASLFSARGKLAIRLLSLSDQYATAACSVSPPCDSFAYLVRNKIKVPAVIAWTAEGRFGLRFEEPLADERRNAEFRRGRRRRVAPAAPRPDGRPMAGGVSSPCQ